MEQLGNNIMKAIASDSENFELIFNEIKVSRHNINENKHLLSDELRVRVYRNAEDSSAIKFEFEYHLLSQVLRTYEDIIVEGINRELGYANDISKEEEYVWDGPSGVLEIKKSKENFKLLYQEPFYEENGYTLLQLTKLESMSFLYDTGSFD